MFAECCETDVTVLYRRSTGGDADVCRESTVRALVPPEGDPAGHCQSNFDLNHLQNENNIHSILIICSWYCVCYHTAFQWRQEKLYIIAMLVVLLYMYVHVCSLNHYMGKVINIPFMQFHISMYSAATNKNEVDFVCIIKNALIPIDQLIYNINISSIYSVHTSFKQWIDLFRKM